MENRETEDRPRVVILLGPTGSGKSALAVELVEALGGEIISADSMQVYRFMDIGTDKPTREDRARVRHHLIDVADPDEPFHAGLYRKMAMEVVGRLSGEGKRAWVVGGTGLYLRALTQGLFAAPDFDPGIRERLRQEAGGPGRECLYRRLQEVDPASAARLHPNDLHRIIRALEVYEATGLPISAFQEAHRFADQPFRVFKVGLRRPTEVLYERIDARVDRMVERGLLKEVEGLIARGYGADLKPMQGLGYKQTLRFLAGETPWDEAIRQIKRDTRHFARRQGTWFKADPEIQWYDPEVDREKILAHVRAFWKESGR
jgi:tRNA dimethylallyltransferase